MELCELILTDTERVKNELIKNGPSQLVGTIWFDKMIHICCEKDYKDILELLFNFEPKKVSCLDIDGRTPLMNAILNKSLNVALLLLTNGDCCLGTIDSYGNTLLHYISYSPFTDMILLLCKKLIEEYPVFIGMKNLKGETPLHISVKMGNIEFVDFLLYNGARVEDKTFDGKSVMEYAFFAKNNSGNIIQKLQNYQDVISHTENKEQKETKFERHDVVIHETKTSLFNFTLFKTKEQMRKEYENDFKILLDSFHLNEKMTFPLDSFNRKKKFRMISIDGGGSKCTLQALIFARLVNKFPTLLEEVNLFCGVSASSFICADLALGIEPQDVAKIMIEMTKHMFEKKSRGYTESLYSNTYIIDVANMTYGEKKLTDLKRNILINAFQFDSGENDPNRCCKACVFNNFIPGHDCKIADACLRSSAAVGYYPPYQGYADGGIFENNPCVCAFPYVFGDKGFKADIQNTVCLSISSGRPPVNYMDRNKYTDAGMFQLLPITMDGFFWSRKSMADDVAKGFLGDRYMRFDPVLPGNLDLDCSDQIDKIIEIGNTIDITSIEDWIKRYWL
ncbi:phospholipase, patatin family protein [Entamoeba histolytica HM-1:IMSS-B]|uniref:phospholipase A2 n=6 Tax=Entamoeba histolytica TaxID=5759 RepID=C4LYA2_ENTH1|nr:phospholipase, patatin family protein [Entamoeba histolytica HM-1:IMSS]EMD47247.1 phospholipase patatin family protein [Entamoeba histolytica KU27]EMH78157.1 phospholipase, patatin family protein [Entamoeba histolytica HM-1:IMSS-B]ENY65277.1 phospholipase, patatin family protein, putative [Entamoeba histolytica HM-1:IMSS-A]GAT93787.1 phospholipase patatin family protein [Entamoeba histolytica]EAL49404.1 phospholipase, patatin family protein [Entamoeba histolytica HM-1:IMSS]|eukprot:XP_654790.1 phospholipase, patatin family protein [Entamoeba histolytica HM-1:IMSS]